MLDAPEVVLAFVSKEEGADCKDGGLDIGVNRGIGLDASDSLEFCSPSPSKSITIRSLCIVAIEEDVRLRSTDSDTG